MSIVSETEFYYQDGFYAPSCEDTNTLQSDSSSSSKSDKKSGEKQKRSKAHLFKVKSKLTCMPINVRAVETLQISGAQILNAITGLPYRNEENKCCRYGSSDEFEFFKVRDISNLKKRGLVFFYESPEQYERHFHKTVPENVKKVWTFERM